MMALVLTETDVQELFPMERAIECVEASFIQQHSGRAVNRSRQRIYLSESSLHYMAAALLGEKLLGMKVYTVVQDTLRFVVLLFNAESGDLLALIEADHLGRRRTGAASGVATRYLARQGSSCVGLIGAGSPRRAPNSRPSPRCGDWRRRASSAVTGRAARTSGARRARSAPSRSCGPKVLKPPPASATLW